jgi:hypothetical protein
MHFSLSKGDLPPIIYAPKSAETLEKDQKIAKAINIIN